MLTIIFGAGASFDSAPINSSSVSKASVWRPPLTKDLFHPERIWFNTQAIPDNLIPIIERIRRDTRNDSLESALDKLKTEVESNPSRWNQILAVQDWLYFVISSCSYNWNQALGKATTYVDLLSRLHDWQVESNQPINLITFNYDNLLEEAVKICYKRNFELSNFNGYLSDELKIFKPHGSIDWWWDIKFDPDRKVITSRPLSDHERKNAKLCFGKMREGIRKDNNNDVFCSLPALAIPVISKSNSDFVFPPGHYEKMLSALDSTSSIIVIGWAGAEEHFMIELSKRVKKDVPVLTVCGSGGDQTVERMHNLAGLREVVNAATTFSDFLDNTNLENWLNDLGKD